MKKYEEVSILIIKLDKADVITCSVGGGILPDPSLDGDGGYNEDFGFNGDGDKAWNW